MTCIVAIKFEDFVIIASDKMASIQGRSCDVNEEKIFIGSGRLSTGAGSKDFLEKIKHEIVSRPDVQLDYYLGKYDRISSGDSSIISAMTQDGGSICLTSMKFGDDGFSLLEDYDFRCYYPLETTRYAADAREELLVDQLVSLRDRGSDLSADNLYLFMYICSRIILDTSIASPETVTKEFDFAVMNKRGKIYICEGIDKDLVCEKGAVLAAKIMSELLD
ncbi:hypothetical protein V0M98_36835 (plasmid) [Pseudomonas silesiensis]|uniref:hypothetical protein n=1 Tax=Pseudomonas silesiensis TaxID=1853130 RepID=UPI0030CF23EF